MTDNMTHDLDTIQAALEAAEDAVTYDSEEAADAGQYALPMDVLIKIRQALALVKKMRDGGCDAIKEIISDVLHDNSFEQRCDVLADLVIDKIKPYLNPQPPASGGDDE